MLDEQVDDNVAGGGLEENRHGGVFVRPTLLLAQLLRIVLRPLRWLNQTEKQGKNGNSKKPRAANTGCKSRVGIATSEDERRKAEVQPATFWCCHFWKLMAPPGRQALAPHQQASAILRVEGPIGRSNEGFNCIPMG